MTKKTVIIVPFDAVPQYVPFRYGRQWWRKRPQTLNCALSLDGENLVMNERAIVAIQKKDLKDKEHYNILHEFMSSVRWPRLR